MELMYDNSCGPVARYSDAHLFLVLDILQRRGHIGRKGLMEDTGLGEGSTRGMLKVRKDWKWVEIKQTGVFITEFGRQSFEKFKMRYTDVLNVNYAEGRYQQGIIIEGVAYKVTNGMEQRDLAVRNGATGAATFVMRDDRVIFPKNWDVDKNDPRFAEEIRAAGMKNEDVLILVDSNNANRLRVMAAAVGLAMR